MSGLRFTYFATLLAVIVILIIFDIPVVTCDVSVNSSQIESAKNVNDVFVEHNEVSQNETLSTRVTMQSNVDETKPKESSLSTKGETKEKVRMVTKEELALHDGKQMPTVWLSIMSKVFDVSAGPEYYSENGPYRVFVAREGNVPFVTGTFTPEEAAKPLSSLKPHELSNLEHWLQFYIDEEKYPFIGLLEGDLYDKDGNPTDEMKLIEDKIAIVKANVAERQKKTANIIARRKKEDEERKKEAEKRKKRELFEELRREKIKGGQSNFLTNNFVWQFFQGRKKETTNLPVNKEL